MTSPSPFPPPLSQPLTTTSLCFRVWLLDSTLLSCFTRHNVLQVHPWCLKRKDFLLFKGWKILHCVCVYLIFLLFLYLLTDPEIDSVSWPLWAMLQWTQRADMSVRSWPPLWIHTLGWNCWVMWWVVLCLVVWGNSILVSAVAAPVAFPTTLHKALFPPHFGSSCLFPSSRVSVTRAVASPGSDVCICVSVSVCVYMCVYICV